MGTLLAVSLPAHADERRRFAVAHAAFSLAARCEQTLNRHDPRSQAGRLNRAAGSPVGIVAPELARILRSARALSRRLDGAFDPAAGPLVDLWRKTFPRGAAPSPSAVAGARARAGPAALVIAGARVALPRRGSSIDLDAFAKGLALDRIAARLRRSNAAAFLNFGESSLAAVGALSPHSSAVLLRHSFGGFAGTFALRDRACSTSAALGPHAGRAGAVIVDPRTGQRVERRAQVTVLARSAAVAEAVSTALLVLGRGAVDEIAARLGVDVCWIDRAGIYTTPRFTLDPAG